MSSSADSGSATKASAATIAGRGSSVRRICNRDITWIRTPFRSPQANAIAARWVRSVRNECLDHLLILNERHLRRVLVEYVAYLNRWRRPGGRSGNGHRAPRRLRCTARTRRACTSSRDPYSAGYITCTILPHNMADQGFAPYRSPMARSATAGTFRKLIDNDNTASDV